MRRLDDGQRGAVTSAHERHWLSRLENGGFVPATKGPHGRDDDDEDGAEEEEFLLLQPRPRSRRWEVLGAIRGGTRVIEIVHLERANFGVRVRDGRGGRRSMAPPRNSDQTPAIITNDDEDRTPTCVVGPHWWLMFTTFTIFLIATTSVTALTAPSAGRGEWLLGLLLSTACLSMYALVGCTNPGIVEPTPEPPLGTAGYTYCDHCASYRPPRALHCLDCRVCIEEYDHHCPWTGKCIGRRNVRYFYGWLLFLVLAFVYQMIEFTTYMLPPEDRPMRSFDDDDDDDDSFVPTERPAAWSAPEQQQHRWPSSSPLRGI